MSVISRGYLTDANLCVVRVDVLSPYGVSPRRSVGGLALIDTGAEMTMISESLAEELGLPTEGVAPFRQAVGEILECLTSACDLVFHSGDGRENRMVAHTITTKVAVPSGDLESCDLIIGADVLANSHVLINYVDRFLTIAFD